MRIRSAIVAEDYDNGARNDAKNNDKGANLPAGSRRESKGIFVLGLSIVFLSKHSIHLSLDPARLLGTGCSKRIVFRIPEAAE